MTIKQIDEGKENFLIDLWYDNVVCEKRAAWVEGGLFSPPNFFPFSFVDYTLSSNNNNNKPFFNRAVVSYTFSW